MDLRGSAEVSGRFGMGLEKTCGNYGRAGYADLYEKGILAELQLGSPISPIIRATAQIIARSAFRD
jgi:hypothetical protein